MSVERQGVVLSWLKNHKIRPRSDVFSTRYVSQDDDVLLDENKNFFRCVSADGLEVETWLDETQVRVNYRKDQPDVTVNWFSELVGDRSKSLDFEEGAVFPDQLEGEEQIFIENFVALLGNKTINPLGMRLQDGVYKCPFFTGLTFDVSFGLSGRGPCLTPIWPEGYASENATMPWEMRIGVGEAIQSSHDQNEEGDLVEPGGYTCEIRGWKNDPFFVNTLRLDGDRRYHMDENTFLENVVDEKIWIFEILTDKRRRY